MADMSKVVGIVGWQNSGKTTLIVDLVTHLTEKGIKVSTVKHAHHAFDIDKPGKDSFKHRDAGASEVMIASASRWALMHELRDTKEPDLPELVARMADADIIIAEGFKRGRHAKLEIWNDDGEMLALTDDTVDRVILRDAPAPEACTCPTLPRDDVPAIANRLLEIVQGQETA